MRSPFKQEQLEACVRRSCPGAALRFEPIRTGKFNDSFFVWADGEELVLRIAPPRDAVFVFYERDMMRQEPGIHGLVLEHTRVPVARVIDFDESHTVLPRTFMLMERLPGAPMTEAAGYDAETVLRQVGECLAEVHALTAEAYGYLGEHAPMPPRADWAGAFSMMWRNLVDDVVAAGHYSEEEAADLCRLLDRYIQLFDRDVPASLLHMDIWAQNILVDGNGLTGIVDWDRALWGDPEIEFAVLDYCGISRPAFWEGYGAVRDESHEARIRNVFYLLYEIQKYIVIRQGRGNDAASARQYKRQTMDIVGQAFGGLPGKGAPCPA